MASPSLPAPDDDDRRGLNIRALAAAAGVSIGTVSRALKNRAGVSDATRQTILALAAELGYDQARLRPGRSLRVLFLLNRAHTARSANPFYPVVLQGVEEVWSEADGLVSFVVLAPADPVERILRRHEAQALIAAGYFEPELLARIRASGLPLAVVDHFDPDCFCINDDNLQGAFAATRHLIAQGRERIAMISGPPTHHSIALRAHGYRKALFEAGRLADPDLEITLDPRLHCEPASQAAMRQLLALPHPPDAVFAYNDETALAAMRACQEAGVAVPRDIAFVGYDDIAAAALATPPLATVRVDKEELGREAARQLLQGRPAAGERLLPVQLVLRESAVASAAVAPAAATMGESAS
ncbi:LacI family DNA-binding transcriptional regulator [Niveibacterium sp. SC-1]|uniref:LacI family DNA-binding transcriptional regulator n=1 Tax=Niveibacterium sp. SC-1 TaxID=3135646 RepID=UPI00311DA6EB